MTIDQLEMLEALIEEGSFRKAATKLHKSQPSLSVGIKKLEDEFGIQLLSRTGYRATLTSQGQAFFESVKATLAQFRNLETHAQSLARGVEPQLFLSVDPTFPNEELAYVLNQVMYQYPQCKIIIQAGVMYENTQRVINNQADLAIGLVSDELINSNHLVSVDLMNVNLVAATHRNNWEDLGSSKEVIRQLPQIVVSQSTKGVIAHYLVSDHAQKEAMIVNGLGWGYISSKRLEKSPNLIALDLEGFDDIELNLKLIRKERIHYGPVHTQLVDKLLMRMA